MSNTLTIGELISCATDQIAALTPTPRLEAELMLSHVLQRPRIKLIGYPEHQVDPHKYTLFLSLLERRKQREPLSYLLGQREFWGMSFTVTPDVLIPRPETETLIESALRHVPTLDRPLRVLDLGTGSGVIAVAIATELKLLKRDFSLTAADCSIAALKVARTNWTRLVQGSTAQFILSNWCQAFKAAPHFDLVLSNPPYITDGDLTLAPEVLSEPQPALFSGIHGLDAIGALLKQVPNILSDSGVFLCEIGSSQREQVQSMIRSSSKFLQSKFVQDLAGHPRVLIAKPAA